MGKAFGAYGPVMGLSAMLGPIASGGLISANVLGTGVEDDLPGERARRARRAGARRPGPARGLAFPSGGVVGDGRIRVAAGTAGPAGRGPGRRGDVRPGLPPRPGSRARVGRRGRLSGCSARRSSSWPGSPRTRSAAGTAAAGRSLVEPSVFRHACVPSGPGVLGRVHRLAGRDRDDLQRVPAERARFHPVALGPHDRPVGRGRVRRFGGGRDRDEQARPRVLHGGLVVEAAGLLAIYAVLRGARARGVSTVDLLAPMVVGGIGMGMVFVPLFDIVMAGVRPQEMGSASGVLEHRELTRHVAGHRRDRRHLLRPGRRARPSRGHVPLRGAVDRGRDRGPAGLLVRGSVRAPPRRARETGAPADHR